MMSISVTSIGILHCIRACVGIAVVLALTAAPSQAADPVFPPGSRLGLVPPSGMVNSEAFPGFADVNKNAAIALAALPAAAYAGIEKALDAETLKKQGITLEKREPMQLKAGKGLLLIGRQVADKAYYRRYLLVAVIDDLTAIVNVQAPDDSDAYPDGVVRAALSTLTARATVPDSEELGLLPFTIGDLAGFHIAQVLRGRAVMLSDAPPEPAKAPPETPPPDRLAAHLLLAALPGGPTDLNEHANFARLAFNEIAGIKDVRVTISEPLRIAGQLGYQTMAQAKDTRTGTDVMVVQWLRFGSGGFLEMVGIAPTDNWTSVLARLRTVRDSVAPRSDVK